VIQIFADIRRFGAIGWAHRWKAIALAWIVCLGGWVFVSQMPNQYRASARIYADADAILGQLLRGLAVDSAPANQVELLQRTLLSRPNLERVAVRTGLDLRAEGAAARDVLLDDLSREVRIAAQTRNLFTITYTDSDARMARDVVQSLLALFMEQASASDRQQMENARTFVNQQIAVYEAQLREAEQRRAEFRTRYLDLLPNDGGVSRLEQSRARFASLRGELQDATARREALRQQLEATPATLPPEFSPAGSPSGPGGDPRLAEAERQLRDLRLQFTEQHPAVVAARNAVAELRASGPVAGSAAPRGTGAARPPAAQGRPNPIYEQVRIRLLDTEGQLASLERQVRDEQAQVERLEELARTVPQVQAQFLNLDRDYNVVRRSYEELLERRESVQIAGAARTGADRVRLEVVDPPLMPTAPTGPNRLLFATIVLVAGLGAGAGLAFLLIQLDGSFHTVHDLRKIGLPVIGSVSATDPPKRNIFGLAAFACTAGLLVVTYGAFALMGQGLTTRIPALLARFAA
jgi:polysaccharide chain length determinant protein (PEP-CTERM system associated)